MRGALSFWQLYRARLAGGLAAPVLLSLTGPAFAADVDNGAREPNNNGNQVSLPATATAAAPAGPLTLEACRQIALAQQPAVAAARASLAAAVARAQALDNLHVPRFLARDLPIRRQQSAIGITIAQAGVAEAERKTIYGVTYSYLSAVYALHQEKVADEGLRTLRKLHKDLNDIVKEGASRDITTRHVERVGVYIQVAEGRRQQAALGAQRALSALREAMGVSQDYPVQLATTTLPTVNPAVNREQILALAEAQRGEVIQATNAAEVACLEISAQQTKRLPQQRTFAAGSDIHAQPLPAGSYDENYKPEAVGPEMPTMLAGSRADRVEQARAYNARADAVVAKTRGLVALEADQAYWKWLEASRQVGPYQKAADDAEKISKDLRATFDPRNPRVGIDELLNAGILSSQLRVQANQARYQLLLALAMLERVTGGAFCAGFEITAPPNAEPANGAAEKKAPVPNNLPD